MVLWFCCRHPKTPWFVKALAVCVVAYALSPIDLIPDFIPVLGYLDDLVLLPLGILLVVRLMPKEALRECRVQADEWEKLQAPRPISRIAAGLIVMIWLMALLCSWWLLAHYFAHESLLQ
ncbi:YkvA family protein [Pseudomonas sp. HMWF032]|uniref:YkvA family protein n=1 Tax=Pseudomonas sp. HMWF032 TaxID=2056866 RepID=UPI003531F51C